MSDDWKQSLKQNGYCQLPGIIPDSMISDARAEVGRTFWAAEKHAGWVPMSSNARDNSMPGARIAAGGLWRSGAWVG